MRLEEEVERTGYFWLPSNPDNKLAGTLYIRDGGEIELEITGLLGDFSKELRKLAGGERIERIVGDVEKIGCVTLDDCFYLSRTISFGGLSKSRIYVHRAFVGVLYNDKEEVLFNTFRFSVEGIDEWVGLSGINVNADGNHVIIEYNRPQDISFSLNNGMNLLINFYTNLGVPTVREARISQKAYLTLISEEERPSEEFIATAYMITKMFCFAIDKTVCIEKVKATSNLVCYKGNEGYPVPITVYYISRPYSKKIPKIDPNLMLFKYNQIQENAEQFLNNWINAHETFSPTLDLYFYSKEGAHKYLDGKFLSLIQGLESYHRRTSDEKPMNEDKFNRFLTTIIKSCPDETPKMLTKKLKNINELTLSQRMRRIIEPFKDIFGNHDERAKLITKIVDTRNYLTHYDESLKPLAATDEELLKLNLNLEVIFQLILLNIIGFTREEIVSIYNNNVRLKQKIQRM